MTNTKSKPLRLTAISVAVISGAIQILFIAVSWWEFDPRLSCDRLPYWGEWIECLHGTSHLYILMIEMVVGSWLVAGVAMLLGRFLRWYISVLAPAGAAVAFIYLTIEDWRTDVTPLLPFGEPALSDIFDFAAKAGLLAVFFMGPVVGAWLFGLSARRASQLPLKVSSVFS